jgi:ribulose-5-phosphate 4-epimerase/fuculose-1-phosphate aldolase
MRRKPCPWTSHPRQGRARHPLNSSKFLLARNMAPGQVIPADILEFDFDGAPLNASGHPVYLKRFIHSETYKARPDAMADVLATPTRSCL